MLGGLSADHYMLHYSGKGQTYPHSTRDTEKGPRRQKPSS